MAKRVYVDDILPIVEQYKGNISAIARHFGVSRTTIHNRINESAHLKEAIYDARQTMVDNAESMLYKAIMDGNMTAIIFFLKTQAKDRGYIERVEQQLSGKDGGPIVVVNWDRLELPDEDDSD